MAVMWAFYTISIIYKLNFSCYDDDVIKRKAERHRLLFCTLDDAPLVRLNDGVSAWIERSYANYLRLFVQFILNFKSLTQIN